MHSINHCHLLRPGLSYTSLKVLYEDMGHFDTKSDRKDPQFYAMLEHANTPQAVIWDKESAVSYNFA